jgi:hypothetical protein
MTSLVEAPAGAAMVLTTPARRSAIYSSKMNPSRSHSSLVPFSNAAGRGNRSNPYSSTLPLTRQLRMEPLLHLKPVAQKTRERCAAQNGAALVTTYRDAQPGQRDVDLSSPSA